MFTVHNNAKAWDYISVYVLNTGLWVTVVVAMLAAVFCRLVLVTDDSTWMKEGVVSVCVRDTDSAVTWIVSRLVEIWMTVVVSGVDADVTRGSREMVLVTVDRKDPVVMTVDVVGVVDVRVSEKVVVEKYRTSRVRVVVSVTLTVTVVSVVADSEHVIVERN